MKLLKSASVGVVAFLAACSTAHDAGPNLVVTAVEFVGPPKKGPCNQVRISFVNEGGTDIDTPFDIGISFDQRSPVGRKIPWDVGYKKTYSQTLPRNSARTVGFLDVELPIPAGVPILVPTVDLLGADSGNIWGWVDMPFDLEHGAIDEHGHTWELGGFNEMDPHDYKDNQMFPLWTIEGYCSEIRIADAWAMPGQQASFAVTMNPASNDTVVVGYTTKNGTAKGTSTCNFLGGDPEYVGQKGAVTFAPGETHKAITVPTCPVSGMSASASFTVELGEPDFAELADGEATGTILPILMTLPAETRLELPDKPDRRSP